MNIKNLLKSVIFGAAIVASGISLADTPTTVRGIDHHTP